MAGKVRVMKTKEERIAILDQKIKFHEEKIDLLKKQKQNLLNPVKRKSKTEVLNEIYKAAKASGKSLEDVLEMLKAK